MTFNPSQPIAADSGKLSVVVSLLERLHQSQPPRDKIVLVSNYTQVQYVHARLHLIC